MFLTLHITAFCITGILSAVSITGHHTDFLDHRSSIWLWHIQGPCCYDTMHVFASTTTSAESLSNLGIPSKSWRFGKILKTLQEKKDSVIIYLLWKSYACTAGLQNELEEYRQTACDLHFAQNKWCLSIVKSVTWWLIKLIVFDLVF